MPVYILSHFEPQLRFSQVADTAAIVARARYLPAASKLRFCPGQDYASYRSNQYAIIEPGGKGSLVPVHFDNWCSGKGFRGNLTKIQVALSIPGLPERLPVEVRYANNYSGGHNEVSMFDLWRREQPENDAERANGHYDEGVRGIYRGHQTKRPIHRRRSAATYSDRHDGSRPAGEDFDHRRAVCRNQGTAWRLLLD